MEKKAHSIKVPRLYKVAAGILNDYNNGKGSVKDLVYGCKKHPNVKAVFALVSESVRRKDVIEKVFNSTKILVKEDRLNENLARILVTELIWGKGGLAGQSRPIVTVLSYKNHIENILSGEETKKLEIIKRPRFVRINGIKSNLNTIIDNLLSQGFKKMSSFGGYEGFKVIVKKLKENEFIQDYHIDNLLVFHPKVEFFANDLYNDGHIVLQDKASCLTVACLEIPPGSFVLDACAAPGMKTIQAAAAVTSKGKMVAIERSKKRVIALRDNVKKHGCNSYVKVMNADFLTLKPQDYDGVEYIVLDPSCSGSGILRETGTDVTKDRLEKLSNLQSKLLRHALSFPNVKKVAYSTCSTQRMENEDVVLNILKESDISENFRLKPDVMPSWQKRGLPDVHQSECFIRADPDHDLCNGFFVAILERIN